MLVAEDWARARAPAGGPICLRVQRVLRRTKGSGASKPLSARVRVGVREPQRAVGGDVPWVEPSHHLGGRRLQADVMPFDGERGSDGVGAAAGCI
jgi:hypothetical protein